MVLVPTICVMRNLYNSDVGTAPVSSSIRMAYVLPRGLAMPNRIPEQHYDVVGNNTMSAMLNCQFLPKKAMQNCQLPSWCEICFERCTRRVSELVASPNVLVAQVSCRGRGKLLSSARTIWLSPCWLTWLKNLRTYSLCFLFPMCNSLCALHMHVPKKSIHLANTCSPQVSI